MGTILSKDKNDNVHGTNPLGSSLKNINNLRIAAVVRWILRVKELKWRKLSFRGGYLFKGDHHRPLTIFFSVSSRNQSLLKLVGEQEHREAFLGLDKELCGYLDYMEQLRIFVRFT